MCSCLAAKHLGLVRLTGETCLAARDGGEGCVSLSREGSGKPERLHFTDSAAPCGRVGGMASLNIALQSLPSF